MPVRSLNSSVLKWPDKETVLEALHKWAQEVLRTHPEVRRIGYFGSYARGDWGVGSDLDLVLIVERSDLPLVRRGSTFDVTKLPVPADLLVYTEEEWQALTRESRFGKTLLKETVWVYERNQLTTPGKPEVAL